MHNDTRLAIGHLSTDRAPIMINTTTALPDRARIFLFQAGILDFLSKLEPTQWIAVRGLTRTRAGWSEGEADHL